MKQTNSEKGSNNSSINYLSSLDDGSKKEEFRKSLEKTNVLQSLTRVLVGLYEEPERPQNAMKYLLKLLEPKKASITVSKLSKGLEEVEENLKKVLSDLNIDASTVGDIIEKLDVTDTTRFDIDYSSEQL